MKYKEIIDRWNKEADEYNSWDNLGEEEKIEFAFQLGCEIVMATLKEALLNIEKHKLEKV